MDRCEACPLFDTALENGDSCGGGLPVSVCITKLQCTIFKLEKKRKIWFEGGIIDELEPSKSSAT